jgi:hypothetical protein
VQRFRALHVRQPPEAAVWLIFIRFALVGMSAPARSAGLQTSTSTSGVTGRSSRWVPRPNPYATVIFGFQLLDPEAAGPIFIAVWSHFYRLVLVALFAVVRAHWSIRSALLASIRVCSQPSRPDLRPSASPSWTGRLGPARVGVVVATEQPRTNANSPELAPVAAASNVRHRAHALGRPGRRSPPRSKHSNSTTSGQRSPANGDHACAGGTVPC